MALLEFVLLVHELLLLTLIIMLALVGKVVGPALTMGRRRAALSRVRLIRVDTAGISSCIRWIENRGSGRATRKLLLIILPLRTVH